MQRSSEDSTTFILSLSTATKSSSRSTLHIHGRSTESERWPCLLLKMYARTRSGDSHNSGLLLQQVVPQPFAVRRLLKEPCTSSHYGPRE